MSHYTLDATGIHLSFYAVEEAMQESDTFNYATVMNEMHTCWKKLETGFVNREEIIKLPGATQDYLLLAAKLHVLAEHRLADLARDKIKYAKHPSFPS